MARAIFTSREIIFGIRLERKTIIPCGSIEKLRRAAEVGHGSPPDRGGFEGLPRSLVGDRDVSRRRADVGVHQRTIQIEAWRVFLTADGASTRIDSRVQLDQLRRDLDAA